MALRKYWRTQDVEFIVFECPHIEIVKMQFLRYLQQGCFQAPAGLSQSFAADWTVRLFVSY